MKYSAINMNCNRQS